MGEICEITFIGGTHIDNAAKQLVAAAREHGEARGTFNGVEMRANAGSTPDGLVALWRAETKRQAEAYRRSPEGRAAEARREAETAALQATHDALVHELASIDPKDDVAVLGWLCRFQPCSDHVDVRCEKDIIVHVLEGAGFRANANTGAAYRADDRDNTFRYLVGQALDGLKNGPAIHPVLLKFADDWRTKFATLPPGARRSAGEDVYCSRSPSPECATCSHYLPSGVGNPVIHRCTATGAEV